MYGPWHSKRLVYRAVEPEDDDFLTTISSDAEAFMNASPSLPTPISKKSSTQFREFLESRLMSAIICLPADVTVEGHPSFNDDKSTKPVPIGVLHLAAVDPRTMHHRHSEIGLNILRPYRSQGFGSEAIQWALHWGFVYAQLHRVGIGASGYNTGAVKLYERLGFVLEGRKRDLLWAKGQYWDLVIFGMLEDEWRERYGRQYLEINAVA